jgi:CubicO group peptidase (beta-lactamase class C family)
MQFRKAASLTGRTVICLFLLFFIGISYAQDIATKADAYLQQQVMTNSFRGSVLIAIDGKILFEHGYGLADEEWNVPNTPNTKFRIASLTKQFTAASVLLLQEQRRLNVHDAISKYLSGLPASWQAITIHQLLTHTSGIPNYTEFPEIKELNRTGATPQELIAVVAKKPLLFPPGTKWSYTNTGYVLLGMLIEKVSGMSYAEFLQQKIFAPLGMKNSGYDNAATVIAHRAAGYQQKDGTIVNAGFIDMTVPFAAGGIYSTVEDMFRWNEDLSHGLLSTASQKMMFDVYPETTVSNSHYGYGVVITERFGEELYYHGGGVFGFASVIQRYPAKNMCIVVLSNLETVKAWEIGDSLAQMLLK